MALCLRRSGSNSASHFWYHEIIATEKAIQLFRGVDYGVPIEIFPGVTVTGTMWATFLDLHVWKSLWRNPDVREPLSFQVIDGGGPI